MEIEVMENEGMWSSRVIDEHQSFVNFLASSTAQSIGMFTEILFKEWCHSSGIDCRGHHKGGADFVIQDSTLIDVKAVRHPKRARATRFRRFPLDRQLPNVTYAYVIFWIDCVELHVERTGVSLDSFNCIIEQSLVSRVWSSFDKGKIKYKDLQHTRHTNSLKVALREWVRENLHVEARVIQRKASANLNGRTGGWGADNFYESPPHRHQLVILLGVSAGEVVYVHSYPTAEWSQIEARPKPVGTNRKEILCYYVDRLSPRYKFSNLEDFKTNVKERFGFY